MSARATAADVLAGTRRHAVIVGHALDGLRSLPDGCVQTCVTSPPYFGLRDYGVDGQIGQETSPAAFVEALVTVFREVRRVLADDGTLWLNLGDSYAATTKGSSGKGDKQRSNAGTLLTDRRWAVPVGLKAKDLMGNPWRVALALQGFAVTPFASFSAWADELAAARTVGDWTAVELVEQKLRHVDLFARLQAEGWWLRSDIIWSKPNPMPESVTDRPTRAHEYVFLLSKRERYFYDAGAIKEPVSDSPGAAWWRKSFDPTMQAKESAMKADGSKGGNDGKRNSDATTRNARTVWTVAPETYDGAHFATMPPELARRCILAGSRRGDVVLDPFAGAGTTALVAVGHGRRAIGCELNPEYAALAVDRVAAVDTDATQPVRVEAPQWGALFGGAP